MKKVIEAIKSQSAPSFESLKNFIEQFSLTEYDYEGELAEPTISGDYGRTIFTLDPFECVLINWPGGSESGIHHHEGLFGYVLVLEGEIDNISYRLKDNNLEEFAIDRYGVGALIPEPDGVIHKIKNANPEERAVSVHFYYPPLKTLGGMKIFDLEQGSIGILSDQAETASWSETKGHFLEVRENAFEFVPFDQVHANKSHIISNVIPKPTSKRINRMNARYFSEQAARYDFYDYNLPKRKSYIETIDKLVAKNISSLTRVHHVLDVACGTGRRALKIRSLTSIEYIIDGIDISEKMCSEALQRGIEAHNEDWITSQRFAHCEFDAITFLYAFGHVPSAELRLKIIQKAFDRLRSGGIFCFDVFNRYNKHEWGPTALEAFESHRLDEYGYEPGDVFYRKNGFKERAFVHYFDPSEVKSLLSEVGFELKSITPVGYSHRSGEVLESKQDGNLLYIAKKPE
ncbi:MAG: methyltransferase domain-containing protein [Flavobacteriales bacterium]